ncbi:MAG: BcepC6B gp40 [Nevskia sp.]|nr:BcepC6B gp40 [Nevskia sp.]
MKLTNSIRDAFVRAAMSDVPEIDYDEQIRATVVAASLAALPPAVRKVYADETTRPYLETTFRRYGSVSVAIPGYGRYGDEPQPVLSKSDESKINGLVEKNDLQAVSRKDLSAKLRGAAYAVTTRGALAEMLPEFEKYLPADEAAANRALPVIANIVADFTKAGWPKGKAKAKKVVAA